MRPAMFSLTLALLCSVATNEAAAQSGNGKRKGPPAGTNPSASQSAGRGHNSSPPAGGAQLGGTRSPWERSGVSRAEWLLSKRLESIDHMREIAQKNGNERMLAQADKLEAIARRQFLIHCCGPKDDSCDPPESP